MEASFIRTNDLYSVPFLKELVPDNDIVDDSKLAEPAPTILMKPYETVTYHFKLNKDKVPGDCSLLVYYYLRPVMSGSLEMVLKHSGTPDRNGFIGLFPLEPRQGIKGFFRLVNPEDQSSYIEMSNQTVGPVRVKIQEEIIEKSCIEDSNCMTTLLRHVIRRHLDPNSSSWSDTETREQFFAYCMTFAVLFTIICLILVVLIRHFSNLQIREDSSSPLMDSGNRIDQAKYSQCIKTTLFQTGASAWDDSQYLPITQVLHLPHRAHL